MRKTTRTRWRALDPEARAVVRSAARRAGLRLEQALSPLRGGVRARTLRGGTRPAYRLDRWIERWRRERRNPHEDMARVLAALDLLSGEDQPRLRENPAVLVVRENPRRRRSLTLREAEEDARARGDLRDFKRAVARYRRFHGRDPDRIIEVRVPGAKPTSRWLVGLGRKRAVEYAVPGSSGRAPGPPYRHEYGPGAWVATTPDGAGVLTALERTSKVRVTDRGIVG